MRLFCAAAIVLAFGLASPAGAGTLELVFDNGRVTVRAADVPLRQILQEWSRRGQTRVVGLEKLAGAPVTVELVNVPEKQALEILLRSIAGYVAAPRQVAGGPALSSFDRLLLLPTSVVLPPAMGAGPRPAAYAPPPPPQPQPQPFVDPIQLANSDADTPAEPQQPAGPLFAPPPDPAAGGQAVRPPPIPGDPGTPALLEPPQQPQQPQGPLTSPRPGILPVPQQQPPPPRP